MLPLQNGLEEQFFGQAMRLRDDPCFSVPAMIARSLASVGSNQPLHIPDKQLRSKLDALTEYRNACVRTAAMRLVAPSLGRLNVFSVLLKSFQNYFVSHTVLQQMMKGTPAIA